MSFLSKTFDEQGHIFLDRNMKFRNFNRCVETLKHVSYYKIKKFAEPFSKVIDNEINYNGVYFEDILTRYYRDKNLRMHILHVLEDIEVALQTQIAYQLGKNTAEYGYLKASNWSDIHNFDRKHIIKVETRIKQRISKQVNKAKENPEVNNELMNKLSKGSNQDYPPVWLGVSLLMFGNLVFMLEIMSKKNKEPIANYFNCSMKELSSYMELLTLVRNICAHNSNLIDVSFITVPKLRPEWKQFLYEMNPNNNVYSNKIALALVIMKHLMDQINPKHKFKPILNIFTKLCPDDSSAIFYGFKDKSSIEKLFS